jgi:L-seryl-tRNA(Ser) seleniumtransferase
MRETPDPGLSRHIPKTDRLLEHDAVQTMLERYPRPLVLAAIRDTLQSLRENLGSDSVDRQADLEGLVEEVEQRLEASGFHLKRVINATGVVLHTNLGRAPLPSHAAKRVFELAQGYCNLEFELESGKRGKRVSHIQPLLTSLTGAQSALVVNNNAAAVLLMLSSLASGKEAVISRGELVEIGGSFRIPEVMAQAGVKLVEVGTTNKTYLKDYERAIGPETAALLKVHPSNFRIVGFHHSVPTQELAALAHERGLLMLVDLGSGCLVPLGSEGLPSEPTVQEIVAAGADVVCFSGDKLLGGPQAGIAAGKRAMIEAMARHPLMRALRVDKLILGALEATLLSYLEPQKAIREIPALAMLSQKPKELEARAMRLASSLKQTLGDAVEIHVVPLEGKVGGGALPQASLPSYAIGLQVAGMEAEELGAALRTANPPVVGVMREGKVLLDVRTILPQEEDLVCSALADVLGRKGENGG